MQNPMSFKAFAEWCERQSGDYVWSSPGNCACAQYAHALGIPGRSWAVAILDKPGGFWDRANRIAEKWPHTFDALARRLREAAW